LENIYTNLRYPPWPYTHRQKNILLDVYNGDLKLYMSYWYVY